MKYLKGWLNILNNLNQHELEILKIIKQNISSKSYPPSVREIGQATGLKSSSTVHMYLKKLEQKGCIKRDPVKPRAINILTQELDCEMSETAKSSDNLVKIPVFGQVATGDPLLVNENIEDFIILSRNLQDMRRSCFF